MHNDLFRAKRYNFELIPRKEYLDKNSWTYSSWPLAHICNSYIILIITAGFDFELIPSRECLDKTSWTYSSWSMAHICTSLNIILIITAGFDYYAKSMFLCLITFFAQSATILSLSPGKSIWTKLHGHTVAGHWHISVIHT